MRCLDMKVYICVSHCSKRVMCCRSYMTSADTCQYVRQQIVCGNASTGLATPRKLNCTVERGTPVAPERVRFHGREHQCNLLRRATHWRGFRLIFSALFQGLTEETSLLLLWWTCIPSGPKSTPCLIKRLARARKLSWTTLYVVLFALVECLATRVVFSSLGHSAAYAA